MTEYALILLGAVLAHNLVLTQFLGTDALLGLSDPRDHAGPAALFIGWVLILSTAITAIADQFLLRALALEILRLPVFMLTIAGISRASALWLRRKLPLRHAQLRPYLLLFASDALILGVALLNTREERGFFETLAAGIGAALGFALVLILFSGLRERLQTADVPQPFKGAPLSLITAGIMSLAFMGLSGFR